MSVEGKRVVAYTPFGREKTVSVLAPYVRRDHDAGVVDEWWLLLNTDPVGQETDLAYGLELARASGGWIKAVERPAGTPFLTPKQRNTGSFMRLMGDPDTVFVRLDDDLIYLHPDALLNLVESKIARTDILGSFGLCWNNAVISWYLQQVGVIPETWGTVQQPYCMDAVGWASGEFAVGIHNLMLDILEGPDPAQAAKSVYLYQDMPLAPRQQFSVSFHAIGGWDYAELDPPGVLDFPEEEAWLTVHRPVKVGKANSIVGDALAVHWTFQPQRRQPAHAAALDVILDRYRALSLAL